MAVTDLDDPPIHQIPYTMDHVQDLNPRWADEAWFSGGTPDGRLRVAVYIGVYPTTNTMDAAASVVLDGVQRDVRFSRILDHDRDRRVVGGLSADITEPMRGWRLTLAPGDGYDVSFTFDFAASHEPVEVSAPVFHRRDGRHTIWDLWHYNQVGSLRGSLTVAGQQIAVDGPAARERSWGVRPVFGQVPKFAPLPDNICSQSLWLAASLGDTSAWLWRMEPVSGRPNLTGNLSDETGRVRLDGAIAGRTGAGRTPSRVVAVEPQLTYADNGKTLQHATLVLHDWDGGKQQLVLRPVSTLYATGLGYGHPSFRHIEHKGASVTQFERHDLSAPGVVSGLLANPAGHVNPFGVEQLCAVDGDARGHAIVRLSI